jgi:predicted short-subunit dehydrogenase-like oxidoreductase (DUF2520 family)
MKKPQAGQVTMSIIGAGRLGTGLALTLAEKGYKTLAVVCRHERSAGRAASTLKGALPLTPARLSELPHAQVILIATPDDAIRETAESLAAVWSIPPETTVLHTSGALSSEVLVPLKRRGASTGSLHPLASVSDPKSAKKSLLGAYYCVEGQRKAVAVAKQIVKALGGHSFSISSRKKPLYHAAALISAGHSVALFDTATEMLSHCGLRRSEAQRVLLPLVRSTIANLERSIPSKALTGTFSRGDIATVREHLRAIKDEGLDDALAIYRLLGLRSLQLSPAVKKDNRLFRDLEDLLSKE